MSSDPRRLLEQLCTTIDGPSGIESEVSARFDELVETSERLAIADLTLALESSRRLVTLADEEGVTTRAARARRAHAHALAWATRFDEALERLDEAHRLTNDTDVRLRGEIEVTRLHALNRLGRLAEATDAARRAIELFSRAGDDVARARAEANLSIVHRIQGQPEEALELIDRAASVLGREPVPRAQLDSNRGEILIELGRFADAEQSFASAAEVFRSLDMTKARAIAEGNLADLYVRMGRYQAALQRFEEARRCSHDAETTGDEARLEAEEAEVLLTIGSVDGELMLEKAIPRLIECGMRLEACRATIALARSRRRHGRVAESLELLRPLAEAESDHFMRGAVQVALAEAEVTAGLDTAAATRATFLIDDESIPIVDSITARALLAVVHRRGGRPADAKRCLDEAIERSEMLGIEPLTADLLTQRAAVNAADALADWRRAVELLERLRVSLRADRHRAAFTGDRVEAHHGLIRCLLDGDHSAAEIFDLAEKARGRSLLESVEGLVEHDPLRAEEPGGERSVAAVVRMRSELNAHYARLLDRTSGPHRTDAAIGRIESELTIQENRLASQSGLASLYARPASADEVQAMLGPGTVLLEYLLLEDRAVVFVVTADGVEVRPLPTDRSEVSRAVRRVRLQFGRVMGAKDPAEATTRMKADADRELRNLGGMLLDPVEDRLAGAQHLHVVPHGVLHAIPFASLATEAGSLVDRLTLTTTPSASLLRHLPDKPRELGSALLCGFADHDVPAIDSELTELATLLPGSRVLRGAEARVSDFMELARGRQLVHLACHGRFAPEHPRASGLRLADRWMTLTDLYGLSLSNSIVTLSACDAGLSVIAPGDDLTGFVRGFFAAGISALIVSLAAVHDETTCEWMKMFYQALADAAPLPEAMRQAAIAIRQRHAHPAYWGTFQLIGAPTV